MDKFQISTYVHLIFTNEARIYKGKKTVSSISGVGKPEQIL